jgi:hypothetical protein
MQIFLGIDREDSHADTSPLDQLEGLLGLRIALNYVEGHSAALLVRRSGTAVFYQVVSGHAKTPSPVVRSVGRFGAKTAPVLSFRVGIAFIS